MLGTHFLFSMATGAERSAAFVACYRINVGCRSKWRRKNMSKKNLTRCFAYVLYVRFTSKTTHTQAHYESTGRRKIVVIKSFLLFIKRKLHFSFSAGRMLWGMSLLRFLHVYVVLEKVHSTCDKMKTLQTHIIWSLWLWLLVLADDVCCHRRCFGDEIIPV